ncbi:MAG: N-acetylneuraminate synthase family protein [Candidatus Lustribacter sp.]|jgi:N-acetylneuraminate synthase/N,N'-diacetyllegionaminate synthase
MNGAAQPIVIGTRSVGPAAPAYIVAEIGINHNGDLSLAKATIEAAARAGADAVKFQNYRTEDFIADRSLTYQYENGGRTIVESQYEMFKRYEMDDAMLEAVVVHARSVGIDVHSTPTSAEGVAALVRLGVGVIKNGSDFLTNTALIGAMARTGLPVVLSAGMATIEEIAAAVGTVRAAGNDRVIVLHCTSSYPAPPATLHLRAIPAIAGRFGCLTGFSDHSEGTAAAIVAIALGACWIEKHFTLDRTLPGPDHRFSSDEAEFRALVRDVRTAEAALADAPLGFDAAEAGMRADARLSCVAATALRRGHALTAADIVFRRPGTGLPPAAAAGLLGKRLRDDVAAHHAFSAADVGDP